MKKKFIHVEYYKVSHSIAKSPPSVDHPYGYENMRYVTSLVSGVGIFCMGAGVSCWHGVQSALVPHSLADNIVLAYGTLAMAAAIDAIVLAKVWVW